MRCDHFRPPKNLRILGSSYFGTLYSSLKKKKPIVFFALSLQKVWVHPVLGHIGLMNRLCHNIMEYKRDKYQMWLYVIEWDYKQKKSGLVVRGGGENSYLGIELLLDIPSPLWNDCIIMNFFGKLWINLYLPFFLRQVLQFCKAPTKSLRAWTLE